MAAIINNRANQTWNKREVRFGWIDFTDDTEVSEALINAVEQWGKERGMTHITGPLGFTDMDAEGMLVEVSTSWAPWPPSTTILTTRNTWSA